MRIFKNSASVDFGQVYDQESDILYVSFNTGEPSLAVEVDDVLIIERGMFTGFPTGFRVLNFKNHIDRTARFMARIKKFMHDCRGVARKQLEEREDLLEKRLDQVFSEK